MTKERFAFGKNWESFSRLIDDEAIRTAEDRMALFLGTRDLSGRTFLDIGCGSGLHALVALRFGAREIVAIDVDPDSVSTAAAVLERNWPGTNKTVRQVSVFDLLRHGRAHPFHWARIRGAYRRTISLITFSSSAIAKRRFSLSQTANA